MARPVLVSRNVRVNVSVWDQAKAIAEADDLLISEVVRDLLAGYVKRNRHKLEAADA